jgi:hypothetical protein
MHCTKCGQPLAADEAFCGNCGAPRPQPTPAPPTALDPRFQHANDEYFKLRGQLATGRITQAQFDAALKDLMIQDAQGRWWMIGAESGKWYVHEGAAWVEADPQGTAAKSAVESLPSPPPRQSTLVRRETPAALPAPPKLVRRETAPPEPPAQKTGGGCGKPLACGCIAIILLCVLIGVGGFLAYQSGAITPATALNLVGLGPGDIEIDNFRDDTLYVTITQLDVPPDSTPARKSLEIKSFDIQAHRVQNPGRYRVEFGAARGSANLGTCTLNIRSGDQYQFVPLPNNIVVNRANNPVSVGADFIVATSALCR